MSAFAWHYDSVPFVCVTMLFDCTDMLGGETMVLTGTGEYINMRGPAMLCYISSLPNHSPTSYTRPTKTNLMLTHSLRAQQ